MGGGGAPVAAVSGTGLAQPAWLYSLPAHWYQFQKLANIFFFYNFVKKTSKQAFIYLKQLNNMNFIQIVK